MMAPSDPEGEGFQPKGTRVDLLQRAFWGGGQLASQLLPPLINHTSLDEQRRWQRRLHDSEPWITDLAQLARHGAGDPLWGERVIDIGAINTPALFVGGWRDLYADAITHAYEEMSAPKKLLMGPWGHCMPNDSPNEPIDFLSIALRWWDHWLRGIDNGVMDEPPVTLYILDLDGRADWRSFEAWPPARDEIALCTGADARLAHTPVASVQDRLIARYEPDPTTGFLGGPLGLLGPAVGLPLDHLEDTGGVWVTSEPLADDLIMCGRAEVAVRLAKPDLKDAGSPQRIVARLVEVSPQGRATFIAGGVVSPDEPSDIYRIPLAPIACRVRAGQQLRVVLSDSDFPRVTPLPNPRPMEIVGVVLVVPTVSEDSGAVVEAPSIDGPGAHKPAPGAGAFGGDMRWNITRDAVLNGVEVVIDLNPACIQTSDGHLLESHVDLRAKVMRNHPGAAVTSATHTHVVRMKTGETITVTATTRWTQTNLWASGIVTIDDLTVFHKVWDRLLGPYEPPRVS